MNLEEYKIELLSDFDELINFYTGKDKMEDFLHNHLAVGFYEKNQFAKLTPVAQMDVWPMYKTIWPIE